VTLIGQVSTCQSRNCVRSRCRTIPLVRRASDGLLPLAGALDEDGRPKSPTLMLMSVSRKVFPSLRSRRDDLVSVHAVAGTNRLNHKESDLGLCEDATAVEHVHERVAGTKLKGPVHVSSSSKKSMKRTMLGRSNALWILISAQSYNWFTVKNNLDTVSTYPGLSFLGLE
jgi:hypothetical protein